MDDHRHLKPVGIAGELFLGGEGVARAYDRLHDEGWTPVHFTVDDVLLVSSMAPTNYLGVALTNILRIAWME